MNLKLKEKELDDLLADEAAQLEAEAQQEISYVVTYRDNADLSWKLDLPKDVEELMKLVEEKKKSAGEYKHIKNEPFSAPNLRFLGASAVLLAAAAPGFATLIYGSNHEPGSVLSVIGVLGTFLGMRLGMTWSYKLEDYMEQRSPKKAKFEKDKQKKIAEKKAENMLLEKKLSHYQKDYRLNDIVLVDDPELGYSLGDIRYNNREETTLHQSYHKLIRGVEGALDNRLWKQMEEHKPIDKTTIVSILQPSYESLSVDDLRYLNDGTPCFVKDDKSKYPASVYGFFRNGKMPCGKLTGLIELRTQRELKGPGEYWYTVDDVEQGNIFLHTLKPTIKSRF